MDGVRPVPGAGGGHDQPGDRCGPTAGGPLLSDGHWSGSLGRVLHTPTARAVIAFGAADNATSSTAERPITP